jgi:3-hydroxyisobutyrate dehydrogenase-like beta-hydroxyacid dehydrogenase
VVIDEEGSGMDGTQLIVGFVGLGDMGGAMATTMSRAGIPLVGFDVRTQARDQHVSDGGAAADSLAEVVEKADVVSICVVNDEQTLGLVTGPDGVLALSDTPRILVVHSTVTPQTMEAIDRAAAEKGWRVVAAQVTGGRMAAEKGELTLMVSGKDEAVEPCRQMFGTVGGHIFYLGEEIGLGAVAKLCTNLMANIINLATIESAKLARAYGLDEKTLMEVAAVSTGRSWWVSNWGFTDKLLLNHRLAGGFGILDLFTKDFWHAVEAGRARETALPLTAAAGGAGPMILAERLKLITDRKETE